MKLFVSGAAGLVGQNLIPRLKSDTDLEITAVDKHPKNTQILRALHPEITVIEADMAEPGTWEQAASEAEIIICLQAQIGGLDPAEFERNNISATERLLAAAKRGKCAYFIHVSSSVINSAAVDLYTESKKAQEALVAASGIPHIILRPTLMFGWFDRKHLGWLKRFMERVPVFPVPGHGRYLRQPLYGGDFAAIVASAVEHRQEGTYDISGLEKIDYIDLIRLLKEEAKLNSVIVKIPYGMFDALLRIYAVFDSNPPFTSSQLAALVTPDVFDVIDWPGIFKVQSTPLREALNVTLNDPVYSKVTLEF